MTQKVATERRIKLRQETTSLGQIVTVTVKLRISDKEQWFGLFITNPECREEGNFRQFSLRFRERLLAVIFRGPS